MVGESFNAVDVGECFDVVDRSVATTGRRKRAYGEGRVHFSFIGDNHSPRQPKQTIRKGVLVSLSTEVDEPIDVSDAVDITDGSLEEPGKRSLQPPTPPRRGKSCTSMRWQTNLM